MQPQTVATVDVTHINGETVLFSFTVNVVEFVYYRYNIFHVLCKYLVQEETVFHKL